MAVSQGALPGTGDKLQSGKNQLPATHFTPDAQKGGLRASKTVYVSWEKGPELVFDSASPVTRILKKPIQPTTFCRKKLITVYWKRGQKAVHDDKVIGFWGYIPPVNVCCNGDACIIAGSQAAFKKYLALANNDNPQVVIKKTRFGEIIQGLLRGGAYDFDLEAYQLFYPLAQKAGYSNIPPVDFGSEDGGDVKFVYVKFTV